MTGAIVHSRRDFLIGAGLAAVLPVLRVARADDGVFDLVAGPADVNLYGDEAPASPLWTYNGRTPGPEIRVRRGERVRVRFRNDLDEPTSVHWHGIRIANAMDGVAGLTQDAVPPGETFDYDFEVPDAGTFWYHAHNKSWNQVGRGLYGPLIVDEDMPALPAGQDRMLVIDDWRLDEAGRLDTESFGSLMDWSHAGRLGNWLMVNGQSEPVLDLVAGAANRLRLINVSNARILQIDPGFAEAAIIAYDGQPLADPVTAGPGPLLLGPSQRIDLKVVPEAGGMVVMREVSGGDPLVFATFASGDAGSGSDRLDLSPNALPEPDMAKARTIRLDLTGGAMGNFRGIVHNGRELSGEDFRRTGQVWAMNGIANLAEAPLFSAVRGETIVIETVNDTAWPHAMHLHGHHFRILDGSLKPAGERPWRDTFLIDRDETARIAFVADNPGKWLIHCHMLEHAAGGMNAWFEVA